MAQTKMLPTKISIKGEAKCQQSSAKTTWIYIQKKRQSRVAERPQARGVRSPGFSTHFCQTLHGTFCLLVGSGFPTCKLWFTLMASRPSALSAREWHFDQGSTAAAWAESGQQLRSWPHGYHPRLLSTACLPCPHCLPFSWLKDAPWSSWSNSNSNKGHS